MTTDWIPFEEGEYWVEQAYLVAAGGSAVALEQPYVEIAKNPSGQRSLIGRGLVFNLMVVELLEDSEELDILLDLGGDFKYRLAQPRISAGKVFAADTKSSIQFAPIEPWQPLSREEFQAQMATIKRIDRPED